MTWSPCAFDGVESQASVWVNGAWVGMARGSRLAHEFDITDRVHPGENTITVRVHQFSPGSYLEDQDQWWLPGIFRSVSLRRLAPGSIEDLWIDTDYEVGVGYATVEARVLGAHEASLVGRLAIDGLGTCLLALEKGDDGRYRSDRLQVGDVRPWNPEDPALYEARVSINGEMASSMGRDACASDLGASPSRAASWQPTGSPCASTASTATRCAPTRAASLTSLGRAPTWRS